MHLSDVQSAIIDLFQAGVLAAHPETLLREIPLPPFETATPVALIALGKAAVPMATIAHHRLANANIPLHYGVVIGHVDEPSLDPTLTYLCGDHPVPGARSIAAARAIKHLISTWPQSTPVWVLVSGGTTSLLAAPLPPANLEVLSELWCACDAAGLPIEAMNDLRGRILQYGAGRLATALRPRPVYPYILSDVIGNRPTAIGSGPCSAYPANDAPARALLDVLSLSSRSRDLFLRVLDRHPVPTCLPTTALPCLFGENKVAQRGAALAARQSGWEVVSEDTLFAGDAASTGREFASTLLTIPQRSVPQVLIQGGETTVTLGDTNVSGLGGRNQEAALAAARQLDAESATECFVLCAGTDGRDGATDAAGAIVHGLSWGEMIDVGVNPAACLREHRSSRALSAVGALVVTGATGTNVMDLMLGVVPPTSGWSPFGK